MTFKELPQIPQMHPVDDAVRAAASKKLETIAPAATTSKAPATTPPESVAAIPAGAPAPLADHPPSLPPAQPLPASATTAPKAPVTTSAEIVSKTPPVVLEPTAPPNPLASETLIPTQPSVDPSTESALRDIHADIEKILKSTKLPERPTMKGSGDTPKGIPLTKPKTAPTIIPPPEPLSPAARAGLVVPPPAPGAPPPLQQSRTGVPEESGKLSTVHTLRHDLQHVVTSDKVSLVHAAALEQDRVRQKDTAIPHATAAAQRNKRTFGFLLATFLFLFLGAAALFGVYIVTQQRTAPAMRVSGPSLIFAEQEVALPLDNTNANVLRTQLAQARNAQTGALGSITRVVPLTQALAEDGTPTMRASTFGEFMTAINIEPPEDLMRALDEEFFLGFHTIDETVPLIVVPVLAYDRAFAGMLAWESHLNDDLAPVFTAVPRTTINEFGVPTVRPYGDYVLRNYDVRALKDDQGVIQLYYSFPNPQLLIIAESPYTFTEVLSRLQASRRL